MTSLLNSSQLSTLAKQRGIKNPKGYLPVDKREKETKRTTSIPKENSGRLPLAPLTLGELSGCEWTQLTNGRLAG